MLNRLPTAPLAALGLIAGFAVAIAADSRPLGGVVIAGFGLTCIHLWLRRDGRRIATRLTLIGLAAFILSHGLGLLIGAWPAVVVAAAVTSWCCWHYSDSKRFDSPLRLADSPLGR